MRTLSVVIYEAEPDEGGFWAEVPELPGCVAQGETINEVQANVFDAVQVWLDTKHEIDGQARRPAVRAITSVVIEDDLIPA